MDKGHQQSFVDSVKETFRFKPEKYDEFAKIINDACDHIIDEASAITRMTQLMKEHRNLLLGLRDLFPEAEITIPPETREFIMSDASAFLNNVKIRSQIVDDHVYPSVLRQLELYREGKKPLKKMKEKVLDLLYYHEDLTEQFLRFFP